MPKKFVGSTVVAMTLTARSVRRSFRAWTWSKNYLHVLARSMSPCDTANSCKDGSECAAARNWRGIQLCSDRRVGPQGVRDRLHRAVVQHVEHEQICAQATSYRERWRGVQIQIGVHTEIVQL